MENLRKKINVRTVKNVKTFLKYVSRPTYKVHKIFDKNLKQTDLSQIYSFRAE